MAASEMYDYLSSASADYTTTNLDLSPQNTIIERGEFHQTVHEMDDTSDEVITISNTPYFRVTLEWNYLSESDAGTIFDFYFDTAKAKGRARSFQWVHEDGHTYVCKFASVIERELFKFNLMGFASIQLKVIGYV